MIISRRVTQKFLTEDLSSLKQNLKQIDMYMASHSYITICTFIYIISDRTVQDLYFWLYIIYSDSYSK